MGVVWPALRATGLVCLTLFSVYAFFVSENRSLMWLAFAIWGFVFWLWWLAEHLRDKERAEKRFERLAARLSHLERRVNELDEKREDWD